MVVLDFNLFNFNLFDLVFDKKKELASFLLYSNSFITRFFTTKIFNTKKGFLCALILA